MIDAVLLKPSPCRDPDRLLMVLEKPPGSERNSISAAKFLNWRKQNHVFEQMSAITGESFNLAHTTQPEQMSELLLLKERVESAFDYGKNGHSCLSASAGSTLAARRAGR